jgi:hypothetical protein
MGGTVRRINSLRQPPRASQTPRRRPAACGINSRTSGTDGRTAFPWRGGSPGATGCQAPTSGAGSRAEPTAHRNRRTLPESGPAGAGGARAAPTEHTPCLDASALRAGREPVQPAIDLMRRFRKQIAA